MTQAGDRRRWLVLPARGTRVGPETPPEAASFLMSLAAMRPLRVGGHACSVLDSVCPDGVRLVEMTPEAALALRGRAPGLRVLPEVFYRPALAPRPRPRFAPAASASRAVLTFRLVLRGSGAPLARAEVVAFSDLEGGVGVVRRADAQGRVQLPWSASRTRIDALYVIPVGPGSWGFFGRRVAIASGGTLEVEPLVPTKPDALRKRFGRAPADAGHGVRVGIVDTGVGPHADLVVAGGRNTVWRERPDDFGDSGAGHGTHVAGIVAARGGLGGQRDLPLGLAPGVALHAYRVFGKQARGAEGPGASNYAILKAIDRAVRDGCDLVNLSLGGGDEDEALADAVGDARAAGTLCIAAAGNEDRSPVSFPARLPSALAVSAVGRTGTWPKTALAAGDVAAPRGKDKRDFLAAFTNVGRPIDFTAPGVGVVSTFFEGYAPLSGTSMACPAVLGVAARLLAASPALLAAPRKPARSAGIVKLLVAAAARLGFRAHEEGHGLPGGA